MAELIIPPSYRAAHRAGVKRYIKTGEHRYFDQRLRFTALRRDGTEFPVELTITCVPGRETVFTGFIRDLTEERKAEQERERLVDELTRAEENQRFLSEASKRLSESLDYEVTLANVAQLAVPTLGDWCAVDMMEGDRLRRMSVAHVDPSKRALVEELANRYPADRNAPQGPAYVARTGESEVAGEIPDSTLMAVARDPQHLLILRGLGLKSYISVPICIRGAVFGAITIVSAESGRRYTDTDLPLLEELALRVATAIENARLYSETRAAVRTREDVLAMVSHDLRNPLNTISMSADALSTVLNEDANPAVSKQSAIIRRAANRMEHLIGDLLDMASIQAKRLSIHRRKVNLSQALNEAFEAHEPTAREADISFRKSFNNADVIVFCDYHRLIQALTNLVGNALKFCTKGNTVILGATQLGTEVLISVSDTGPGIESSYIEEIFNPYWTVAKKGTQSTGLGLYITKGIVEAHSGRIWVKSEPGLGTTFFFTLPIDPPTKLHESHRESPQSEV